MKHPLVGSMTNMANEVHEHLARVRGRPEIVVMFLDYLHRASWGWAGSQAQRGYKEPGAWCHFSLQEFMEKTGLKAYEVYRARKWLVNMRIISYTVNTSQSNGFDGRIDWNLHFEEWIPLQADYIPAAAKWGGARKNAGRPRKQQPGECNLKQQVDGCNLIFSDSHSGVEGAGWGQMPSVPTTSESGGNAAAMAMGNNSSCNRLPGESQENGEFKLQPLARSEAGAEQAREASGKREETKEEKEEITKAPSALEADASPAFCWPPRHEREKDLDYYQRILKEDEKHRVALLTRMAYERIGSDPAAYSRVGSLAKKCGAALLAKYILQAAASHIDGDDPLSYLTKIVNRQEGTNGTRAGPRKRETYQQQSAAGANGTGTGGNAGNQWAGWDYEVESV